MAVKAKGRATFVKNIPGDAAVSVDLTPRQIILNTNSLGMVEDFSGAVASVVVFKGSERITPTNIAVRSVRNCVAQVDTTAQTVSISQVAVNGDTGYSHEYGSVDLDVRVGTHTFTQKLTFVVNIHKVVASMKVEQDSILSEVNEIRSDALEMRQSISTISQKADEIEISVGSRKIGGRNLLYDTAFRDASPETVKDGMRVRMITREFSVTNANGLDGDNVLKYDIIGSADNTFAGVFYEAKVTSGEVYTISVYVRSEDVGTIDNQCWMELYHKKQGQTADYTWGLNIKPTESGKWQRFVRTFTVEEGDYDSVAVNIFLTRNGRVQFAHPQLERGNVATDWSDNPSDMMDSLESAGIKIRKDSIILRGKNVAIEDEDGETETLFLGGKMRGKFVDIEQMLVGEVDARHAIINNLTVTGFIRQRAFHVTQENFYNVTIPKEYKGKISYEVDFTKTGAFIVFDYLPANRTCIIFPSITYNYGVHLKRADIPKMTPFLEQVGQRVFVINNAGTNELHIAGCFEGYNMTIDTPDANSYNNKGNEYAYYKDRYLLVGTVAGLECAWKATGAGANGPSNICVYWNFIFCLPSST